MLWCGYMKPSHRKHDAMWPRRPGRPRDRKQLRTPAWMTAEILRLMRKIQRSAKCLQWRPDSATPKPEDT